MVARNAPEQELERPAAAEPERNFASTERLGDLAEEAELTSGRGAHGADDTHYGSRSPRPWPPELAAQPPDLFVRSRHDELLSGA